MRAGAGKAKGSSFERRTCVVLSLWATHGKRKDCFWRSAISGGRATVLHRKGESNRQAGDITAVAAEGHVLTDQFYIECKHVRNLSIGSFVVSDTGPLATFWRKACREAGKHGREPMLIAKQNHTPTIVLLPRKTLRTRFGGVPVALGSGWAMFRFDELFKAKGS